MSNKIKDTEKIETKNLESIPGENDLPNVKSKEYYEKLVTERRMNSYRMRKNAQEATQKVSAEDLDDVAGGKAFYENPAFSYIKECHLKNMVGQICIDLNPNHWHLRNGKNWEEERKKKEREKKIEQILKLARELDEDRSNR